MRGKEKGERERERERERESERFHFIQMSRTLIIQKMYMSVTLGESESE